MTSGQRTFSSVADVRQAVAESLGFGTREPSPYDEPHHDVESAPVEESGSAPPGKEAEIASVAESEEAGLSEAEDALRSIREEIEREEQRLASQ